MTVVSMLVVALTVGWVAGRFAFGERLETLNSRIASRDEKIAEYLSKLSGASPDEAATRIAALEQSVAALQPAVFTKTQVESLIAALSSKASDVQIHREFEATKSEDAYQQLCQVFVDAGWELRSHGIVYGDDQAKPRSGLSLILPGFVDESAADTIRAALAGAGVAFDERREVGGAISTIPQLLFSSVWRPQRSG